MLDNGVLGADLWLFIQKGPKSGKWCTFSWRQLRRLMRLLGLQESCPSLQSHSGGVRGLRPSTVGRQVQRWPPRASEHVGVRELACGNVRKESAGTAQASPTCLIEREGSSGVNALK